MLHRFDRPSTDYVPAMALPQRPVLTPVTQAVFDAAQFFVNAGVLRVDFHHLRFYVLAKYGTDLVSMDTPSFAWNASGAAAQFAREFRAVPGSDVMARYGGQAVALSLPAISLRRGAHPPKLCPALGEENPEAYERVVRHGLMYTSQ